MGFVQIIEFRSSKPDEMKKLGDEWEEKAQSDSTVTRRVLCEDRDTPGRFFNIVTFESYESAMDNSKNPVTQEFAEKMAALTEGPPTFYNLDVIDER